MEEAIRRPGRATTREGQVSSQETNLPVRVLQRVLSPSDLKSLSRDELKALCQEIRDYIVDVVSQKGGHLGASLGVVELTVALETVLSLPRDKVVWDTGHQAYVHKVLTGRRDALWSIRQKDGISGFLKREESPYDAFGAGHASTAISAALGLATARDLAHDDFRVVAIIGDGAMTGGLAYEALNNAGQSHRRLLVILNDNGMSISPNVGAMAHYLTSLNASPYVKRLRDEAKHLIERLPVVSEPVGELAKRLESTLKSLVIPGGIFQALGFSYLGPVDGHDLDGLMHLLPNVLQMDGPVLLHVMTRKGKGLQHAEDDHESFHGVSPFDKVTGKAIPVPPSPTPAYTKVFGETMLEAAQAFPSMVAITAAMPTGTGLTGFQKKHPERFFDVGIAEAHAVCFAAGLACQAVRPVCAIYSTFLQRAFDQIVHDVALQELPVVFALDRAGLVGADGPTHHGVLDLAYMRCVPGMVVAAPRDGNALRDLLWTALAHPGPFALRFPRDTVPAGYDPTRPPQVLPVGTWDLLAQGSDAAILAVGTMVQPALAARARLAERGTDVTVVDCRFVKPLDEALLLRLRRDHPVLVTVEEGNLPGGFGDAVLELLSDQGLSTAGVVRLGLPDDFVSHGTREELLSQVGLTAAHLEAAVAAALQKAAVSGRDA